MDQTGEAELSTVVKEVSLQGSAGWEAIKTAQRANTCALNLAVGEKHSRGASGLGGLY